MAARITIRTEAITKSSVPKFHSVHNKQGYKQRPSIACKAFFQRKDCCVNCECGASNCECGSHCDRRYLLGMEIARISFFLRERKKES